MNRNFYSQQRPCLPQRPCLLISLLVFLTIMGTVQNLSAKGERPLRAEGTTVLVELFLSADRKEDLVEIKALFAQIKGVRVKEHFYPKGKSPLSIAIGRGVSADAARLAIKVAKQHNGGIHYILPDFLYPLDYIAIGGSHFSEELHVPINPSDVDALSDPDKTTEEWHRLYQTLIEKHPRFHKK